MSDFSTAITNPDLHARFYLLIEGIGEIFLDGEIPIGAAGTAWAAPTAAGRTYGLLPGTLDVSGGVIDVGPEIDRWTGLAEVGGMSIKLADNNQSDLLALFARNKADGNTCWLNASVEWDTAADGSVITVDTTTGFDAAGLIYIGLETLYYSTTASTTFGTAGTKATRSVFDLDDTGGELYGDRGYNHNNAKASSPPVVTDYPTLWRGRRVSLVAFIVDADGYAYDSSFDMGNDYSREIWRGVVRQPPRPMDDWSRWELACEDIGAVLHTEVGHSGTLPRGVLLRFPGGAQANIDGHVKESNGVDGNGEPVFPITADDPMFYLDDSTRFLSMVVHEFANASTWNAHDPSDVYTYRAHNDSRIQLVSSPTMATKQQLVDQFDGNTAVDFIAEGLSELRMWLAPDGASFKIGCSNSHSTKHFKVYLYMDEPGSVGKLTGHTGDLALAVPSHPGGAAGAQEDYVSSTIERAFAYIHPDSLAVPFFLKDSETGQIAAPSAGFANIGGVEIVEYGSITALDSVATGLKQLNVTRRGAMGTMRREHRPTMTDGWQAASDLIEIKFGHGVDAANPIEAILQLAVSTGNAAHHSAYDVLAEGVGAQINPLHFDMAQMQGAADLLGGRSADVSLFMGSETHKLHELAAAWLAPFGLYLAGRPNDDDEYRIQCLEASAPLLAESTIALGTSQLSISHPGAWKDGSYRIITEVELHYGWDNLEGKHIEGAVLNIHSNQPTGERHKLTWKPVGLSLTAIDAETYGLQWVLEILARYSKAYDLFEVVCDRTGWNINTGDVISLTMPSVPTTTGVRGHTAKAAKVLQAEHIYYDPSGSLGSKLLVVVEDEQRTSSYSPAATVASYAAGTPSITLDATSVWTATGETQADHFDNGDVVTVVKTRGDWANTAERTLSAKSGNVFTLDSTLPWAITANTIIVAADYTTAQASQLKHVYIASTATPPALTGADPFRYI